MPQTLVSFGQTDPTERAKVHRLFEILPPTGRPAPSLQEIEQSVVEERAADDERIRAGRR